MNSPAAPSHHPKIELVNRAQLLLRPIDVERLVPDDDPVRAIWEMTGRLDLSRFYKAVVTEEGSAGREAIDPRLLISLWVYAYSQGIGAAREVSRLMEHQPGFQWLSGMRMINHHTLSDFRIRHGQALEELFTQVLGILSSEGLLTLERVMHDGTKIKANASRDTFRRGERLRAHLAKAREQVEAMGDPRRTAEVGPRVQAARARAARERAQRLEEAIRELEEVQRLPVNRTEPEQARVSTTDPEARVMKFGDASYAPGYNVQLSTDGASGAVVGVQLSQTPADAGQLPAATDQITARLGRPPHQMIADAEFTTNETIVAMAERGVEFIGSIRPSLGGRAGSLRRRGVDPAFGPEAFKEDATADELQCPAGKHLSFEHRHRAHFHEERYYRAKAEDCSGCVFRVKCCPSYAPRVVTRSRLLPLIQDFRTRMAGAEAKAIYKRRGAVAEFTNAWIKEKIGLRQFHVRGKAKALMETLWACLTLNIQLWTRRVWLPGWNTA